MKLKEQLARKYCELDDPFNDDHLNAHEKKAREAFEDLLKECATTYLAGFNKAKELLLSAIKDSDTDAWDEDVIMGVGEQEVQ